MGESTSTTVLSGIVTAQMISGVLNEIVQLLPIILPALIGFIAIRKGIGFLLGSLRSA